MQPGVETILSNVKAARRDGNVMLLHDAGGNRKQTIEALPRILDWLYERGDKVVTLAQLLNLPAEQLMPKAEREEKPLVKIMTGSGFRVWHVAEELFWSFMIVATALVATRTLIIAALAGRHRYLDKRPAPNPAEEPPDSTRVSGQPRPPRCEAHSQRETRP